MSLATKLPWDLANPRWAAEINPFLSLPILNGNMLSVSLTATTPQAVNHLLGRKQQGWIIVDNTAQATIWRTKPFSMTTLTIESSATTTAMIWVF